MILEFLKPIGAPFVAIKNKIMGVKTQAGNLKIEAGVVKGYGQQAGGMVGAANDKLGGAQAAAAGAAQGAQAQMQQLGGAAGAAGGAAAGGINPNPPIRTQGFWVFKKKFCSQCNQQLDVSWDACPYCKQAADQQAAAAAAANKPKAPMKTQAFMLNAPGGAAGGMQLLGWIVPMQGPQRGELFTLSPATVIGKDPSCNIVLQDSFMSSKHAEIKAEAGIWVLKDMGSTNGTFVNDKRVDKQELVDNDMIMFGKCLVKFKSL
ncbi:MAG TPA: FHA domain-containing protein [Kofleriaceae bacterium]|nr:FHA domain-containing protein [Kofleriaceae bacterium]